MRAWFDALSKHCRAIDYEGARPIFAEDMIAFGTFTDFMIGRDLAEQKQWRNVWGTIRNFRYDLDKIEAIVSADRLTAVGMGVWQSDGYHPNGDRFDAARPHHGDARPQGGRRSVRRHPHAHVAVSRHARTELRQVRLTADAAQDHERLPANSSEPSSMQAGTVSTQASRMLRTVALQAGAVGEHRASDAGGDVCRADRHADHAGSPMVVMVTSSAVAPWA